MMGISQLLIYELMSLSCVNSSRLDVLRIKRILICNQMPYERKTLNNLNRLNDPFHILCWVLLQSFWKTARRCFKLTLHIWKLILECGSHNDYSGVWRLLPQNHFRKISRSADLSMGCLHRFSFYCLNLSLLKIDSSRRKDILITFMTKK